MWNLLNNDITKVFAFLIFIGAIILIAYNKGYSQCELKMAEQLRTEQINNLKQNIIIERNLKAKQDTIVNEYLEQIESMRAEHEKDIITINNLRDTVNIPKCVSGKDTNKSGVSAKTTNQSGLKCYTESELLRKIERSLAIAREADELAVKYNTLLKTCSTN